MSAASSKKPDEASVETPVRTWLRWLQPKNDWGIAMGTLISLAALVGPWYLLEPLFKQFLPQLPVSVNLKVSLATSIVTGIALLVIAAALASYNKKFRDIGFDKPKLIYLAKAVVAFVLYFVASIIIQIIARAFFGLDQNQSQDIGYSGLSGVELAAAFIPLVILTPLAEETIFRGFLFKGFRRHLPFWAAALGVSALFGLAHGQWNVGLDVFAMSMVSCFLVEKTKSLWPSIFLHALKNGVAFCLLYLYNGG